MYDDILGEIIDPEKGVEIFAEIKHESWCAVYCLKILNEMVEMGIMEMSDGGEVPMVVTEIGKKNLKHYWDEIMMRKPNDEDIKTGMMILKNEDLW